MEFIDLSTFRKAWSIGFGSKQFFSSLKCTGTCVSFWIFHWKGVQHHKQPTSLILCETTNGKKNFYFATNIRGEWGQNHLHNLQEYITWPIFWYYAEHYSPIIVSKPKGHATTLHCDYAYKVKIAWVWWQWKLSTIRWYSD